MVVVEIVSVVVAPEPGDVETGGGVEVWVSVTGQMVV
jgi:hypothetical protein